MKRDRVLNVLSVFVIVVWLIAVLVMLTVFVNPGSPVNPFPPLKLPTYVIIPSATVTLRSLPPTWTVTVYASTLQPSSTMEPTSTGFVLPSFTPTPTKTSTPTQTPTVTKTPTRTPTRTIDYEHTAQALTITQSCQATQAAGGTCP